MKVCWHCFKHRTDAAPYKDFQGTYEEWVQQLPAVPQDQSISRFVWISIQGYEPMENCHTADGQEVGWIRPARIGKSRPQPWGTATDWPGEWQAIPHRYDDEGQPNDWSLATYQPSYAAAKEWIELGWNPK